MRTLDFSSPPNKGCFLLAFGLSILWILVCLAVTAGLIYVIIHFAAKFW